ncbi:MAG: hypothetical protein MUF49_26795 [Oculatellaceae cyanobacterium Prado106]|jgi:hypothetical protein|nr:hypothetical protein [Oculatellaceae cyanobacterium Prado106]
MTWVILFASLIVAFLVFAWLVKVVKATIGTAIAVAVVVLALQLFFGIGPQELWQQISQLVGDQVMKWWDNFWQNLGRSS